MLVAAGHLIDIPLQRLDKKNKDSGITPLQLAAQKKKVKSVVALLSLGASMTQLDNYGKSFLDHAVRANHVAIDQIILSSVELANQSNTAQLLISVAGSDNLNLLRQLLLAG